VRRARDREDKGRAGRSGGDDLTVVEEVSLHSMIAEFMIDASILGCSRSSARTRASRRRWLMSRGRRGGASPAHRQYAHQVQPTAPPARRAIEPRRQILL